jgi:hypothetical protein
MDAAELTRIRIVTIVFVILRLASQIRISVGGSPVGVSLNLHYIVRTGGSNSNDVKKLRFHQFKQSKRDNFGKEVN